MQTWKETLQKEYWREGKQIRQDPVSYRHRPVITCYEAGRQETNFANQEGKFGSYIELLDSSGSPNLYGNNIVPVLPDGRLIMVVEQRPAQRQLANRARYFEMDGGRIDLTSFGPYSSVEFPGGGIDIEEKFQSSFLRELIEETGADTEDSTLYQRKSGVYPFGSDLSLEIFLGVIYLAHMKFERHTRGDGGLHILAVNPKDVEQNILKGNICSGQAAILGWYFYQEIQRARQSKSIMESVRDHITVSQVELQLVG